MNNKFYINNKTYGRGVIFISKPLLSILKHKLSNLISDPEIWQMFPEQLSLEDIQNLSEMLQHNIVITNTDYITPEQQQGLFKKIYNIQHKKNPIVSIMGHINHW